MSFARITLRPQRLLTIEQAGDYLGYPVLLDKMRERGWIKPAVQSRKMCAFDIKALDHCVDRLAAGEVLE